MFGSLGVLVEVRLALRADTAARPSRNDGGAKGLAGLATASLRRAPVAESAVIICGQCGQVLVQEPLPRNGVVRAVLHEAPVLGSVAKRTTSGAVPYT